MTSFASTENAGFINSSKHAVKKITIHQRLLSKINVHRRTKIVDKITGRSFWDEIKSELLPELASHAFSPANLRWGDFIPYLKQSPTWQVTNKRCIQAENIMNFELTLNFETFVDLLPNSRLHHCSYWSFLSKFNQRSDQSTTDLISNQAMDRVSFCRVCLEKGHLKNKSPPTQTICDAYLHVQPQPSPPSA